VTADPVRAQRGSAKVALLACAATLLFAWATWALFLSPRKGGDTVEALFESIAADLRAGNLRAVEEHLDPAFTLDPGGLSRSETIGLAEREHLAERLFPYIAHTHPTPIDDGDVKNYVVLGVLAQGEPERNRNVNLVPVRLEVKVKRVDGAFRVMSARSHLGR
jgi:hypothetical protein